MLVNLTIKNFILIQEISVSLSDQFNVFTGETGAGKSLFVDALNFVSGQRSSPTVVGPNGNIAYVEAVFSFSSTSVVMQELQSLGFIDDPADIVIFSREMTKDGRSTSRINSRMANLSTIRDLLALTLDIHSQHETQYLLLEKNHLNLLDEYLNQPQVLRDYTVKYQEYKALDHKIAQFLQNEFNQEELDFSRFLLEEINQLNPSQEDYDELTTTLNEMENFEKIKAKLNNIETTLREEPDVLGKLHALMDDFKDLDSLSVSFSDLYFQLEDIAYQVAKKNNEFTFDEFEFDNLQSRMLEYTQMIRKYGDVDGILTKKIELEQRITEADSYEDILTDLQNEKNIVLHDLDAAAQTLRQARMTSAHSLETVIVEQLQSLMLDNAQFSIRFEEVDFNTMGIDRVSFMISMNKGAPLAPLSKAASGGELSRLMLGLKVIFSEIQGINTLIFDEIDTGVSGRVAFKMGEKMKRISENAQVITISHLPTVASCANHHFLIRKEDLKDMTVTSVEQISENERIDQLSLMMSGQLTDSSREAALHLFKEGQNA